MANMIITDAMIIKYLIDTLDHCMKTGDKFDTKRIKDNEFDFYKAEMDNYVDLQMEFVERPSSEKVTIRFIRG